MKFHVPLIAGLMLLSGTVAFAQDAGPATPDQSSGKPDDAVAVTKGASADNGATNHQESSAGLADAYKDYQAGNYASAAGKLETIVKNSPKDAQAQELLAYSDLKLNKPADAASHLQAYTQLKPEDLQARTNLGQVYLQTNRPADAVTQFQAVLAKTPKDAQTQFALGVALHSAGQDTLAADAFGKAAQLDPKNANAWLYQGMLDTQAGSYDKAVPALKQALTLNVDDAYDAHAALAQAYSATKDNADALREFAAASQLKPTEPGPLFNLAVLQEQSGDRTGAEASYKKVLALNPTDANLLKPAQANYGLLLAKDNDPDAAIAALKDAAQSDPSNADVQAALGLMYLKKGQKADAKAAYQKALALDPSRTDAKVGLADAGK